MGKDFSAFELLQIASRIERNGRRFYRRAAEVSQDEAVREKFLQLSDWKKQHEEKIGQMKQQLLAEHQRTGQGELVSSPRPAEVKRLGQSVIDAGSAEKMGRISDVADVLEKALELERLGLNFYWGLREGLWGKAEQVLYEIIEQKNLYVRMLEESLERRRQKEQQRQEDEQEEIEFDERGEIEEL